MLRRATTRPSLSAPALPGRAVPVRSLPLPALLAIPLTALALAAGTGAAPVPRPVVAVADAVVTGVGGPDLLSDGPMGAALLTPVEPTPGPVLLPAPGSAALALREADLRATRSFERAPVPTPAPPAPAPAAPAVAPAAAPVAAAPPAAPAWVRPHAAAVSSGYGPRWGREHRGLDFSGGYGSPILAAAAGTVVEAGNASGYGRLVVVEHADGVRTAYGHMSRIDVTVGEEVAAGEVIAAVGSEGRSTGPHLHFEVRLGGDKVDPARFLRERGVDV